MKKNWQNKIGSGTRKRFWESARDIKKIDGEKSTGQRKRERRSSAVAAGGAMDAALEHFWWPWPSEVCVREKGRECVWDREDGQRHGQNRSVHVHLQHYRERKVDK
jgi:hypothetical protein